jgi:two-component system sensor histidine kinase CpxA
LFLKIFLWFTTVVVTVIVGTFIVGEVMRPDPSQPPMRRPPDHVLHEYAHQATHEYEHGGQTELVVYLERMQKESGIRAYLFNSQQQELTGRWIPPGAPDLVRRVLETEQSEVAEGASPPLIAQPARGSDGSRFVLVAEPPRHSWWPFHPIMHMFAVALTGGLFCYWLARHLTSPVTKLRAATRELAKGNLSTRVGPTLGRRRDELASLAADFDVMAEKIQSLVDSQRRLLGDISHELRSPLARLNVALELARQRSGAEATSALERIQLEAEILNEMIGQLLALTRLESGAEEIRETEFDLTGLVAEIVKDADFEARGRDRSVVLRTAERAVITGIPDLIRRAIENVIRNAVHYTLVGTTVDVDVMLHSEEFGGKPDRALIVVVDHGPGVPDGSLKEIFRPFYRVDDARDREAGGVGLGLAIAERAVRLHGGQIAAAHANGPREGLMVRIWLPLPEQPITKSSR